MQTIKLLRIFSLLLAVLLMVSCNTDDDQATGVGDVIAVSKKSGNTTVYGISIYAYSLSSFSSVSVKGPDKNYQLKDSEGNFYFETPPEAYSATKPATGTYDFSAIFTNGVKQDFHNTLTDQLLPVPTFYKCEYNEVKHQLELYWAFINGAASYAVNIFDGEKLVFRTGELKSNIFNTSEPLNEFHEAYAFVRASGSGWAVGFTPVPGKTYTVRVFAYMYEPGGGIYNIQSISMADHSVTWGD